MYYSSFVFSLKALYDILDTTLTTDFGNEGQVWIFAAKRAMQAQEQVFLRAKMKHFMSEWKTHGVLLNASFYLLFDRFLVICTYTDNPASGCATDNLFAYVRGLEAQLNLGFLERQYITYWKANQLITDSLRSVQEMLAKEDKVEEMYYFHNGLNKWCDFRKSWLRPIVGSWLMPSLKV